MIGRRVTLGSIFLSGANFSARFLDIILLAVCARFLAPADFGLVALAASVLLVVTALTEFPVENALVQKAELKPDDLNTAFTLNIARGIAIALCISLLAWPAARIYDDIRLTGLILTLALVPIFKGLISPGMVHFTRRVEYLPAAVILIISKAAAVTVTIAIAVIWQSYWALIAGMVATAIVGSIGSFAAAPYRPRFSTSGWREIFSFSGWITVAQMISVINRQGDRFFIGGIAGKASLGQYTVGNDIATTATYNLVQPLMTTLFGGFSRIKHDLSRLRIAYLKAQQIILAGLFPIAVGLALLAEPTIKLLLGPEWNDAVFVVEWLAPLMAIQASVFGAQSVAMALGKTRLLAIREAIAFFIRLPITVAGAWLYGLEGAIIARAIAGVALAYLFISMARLLLSVSFFEHLSNSYRSLLSGLIMTIVILYLQNQAPFLRSGDIVELLIFIPIGAVCYFTSHFALWLAAGKPDGVERLGIGLVQKFVLSRLTGMLRFGE